MAYKTNCDKEKLNLKPGATDSEPDLESVTQDEENNTIPTGAQKDETEITDANSGGQKGSSFRDVSLHNLEWLSNVLLVKLSRWAGEAGLNTDVTSLKLVSVDRYNQEYQRLKTKYGSHLVSVSKTELLIFPLYM